MAGEQTMTERRVYVLERDHDYPLPGQRWTAYCDDDEGRYAAEGKDMDELIEEFALYLMERHDGTKHLRVTVESPS